jgi:hypothetical protein
MVVAMLAPEVAMLVAVLVAKVAMKLAVLATRQPVGVSLVMFVVDGIVTVMVFVAQLLMLIAMLPSPVDTATPGFGPSRAPQDRRSAQAPARLYSKRSCHLS